MTTPTDQPLDYIPLPDEYDYEITEFTGRIPEDLRGVLYRNGPGKLDAGGQPLGHLFDGDGMISRFAIADGRVHYRNRFVRSKHYCASLTSDGIPFRALGTLRPGGPLANALRFPANVANTGVVMHAGKLLALWEGGPPTELEPETLATVGVHRFGGALRWLGAFSAHPKWDAVSGDMFNFGLAMMPRPKLIAYRVNTRGRLDRVGEIGLPQPMFVHDFGLTSTHLVFVIAPLVFPWPKMFAAGLGLRNYIDALEYQAQRGSLIALLPRYGGKPRLLPTESLMHLHLSNTYDDGADTVVDLVNYHTSWERLDAQLRGVGRGATAEVPYGGRLRRLRITKGGRVIHEDLSDLQGDFPTFNLHYTGSRNRFTYLAVGSSDSSYPNAIAKLDNVCGTQTVHRLPAGHFAHEAVFTARPGGTAEDDGWLLVATQDRPRRRAHLRVLDARRLDAEPLYVGALRHHLPLTFHGSFTPRAA
ncbi:carotenoid oxygenase family protein [Nocardia sp. CDC159]|uniref:Dioxygenase n=1 Tax=Nocardia pulmonis TaxID=2951408 RepID=A0A9X2E4A9_9NOCA|nr:MULTISPECIES: carotenoid oxygenase family protein [Nocardia]MCM6772575.1 carotenoid oxygenase family protein [Nocardia pulmonis]MCM6784767.1 carotenoid oxygenase family protein [Nocardia sp. CDC159]